MPRASVREQLIDAAADQFHEHGFNGSGVKDITDAAGVPKGSFYNHFDSKESLAVEVMRRYAQSRELERLTDPGVEPLDRIRAHFAYLADDLERFQFARGCMFANFGAELSTQSPVIRADVDTRLKTWSGLLTQALEEARSAGSLTSPLDSATLARFLVGAWEGAALLAKVTRTRAPLDDFFTVLDSFAA